MDKAILKTKGVARDSSLPAERKESAYCRTYKRGPDDHISPPLRKTDLSEPEEVTKTEESTVPKWQQQQEEAVEVSSNVPSDVRSTANVNEETEEDNELALPGAFREGWSHENEEEETRHSVDYETPASGTPPHDELYMVEAQAVDEPDLVSARASPKVAGGVDHAIYY